MFLLPDILVDRVLLSTQYPFTLNGELITNIETEYGACDYDSYITFKTTTYGYRIDLYKYKYLLQSSIYDQLGMLANSYINSRDNNNFFNELMECTNRNRYVDYFMDKLQNQINDGNRLCLYHLLVEQNRHCCLDQNREIYFTSKYLYIVGHGFQSLPNQQVINDEFLNSVC